MLLDAFREVLVRRPGALLILAPRHPERFAPVADLVTAAGFRLWQRSQMPEELKNPGPSTRVSAAGESAGDPPSLRMTPLDLYGGVFLLDSIGELAAVYSLAAVAFVGGSLVPRGGHNILEAAQHGVPIVVGPYTENFRDMVHTFERAGAVRIIAPAALTSVLLYLLENPADRQALGTCALEQFQSQAGATTRTLEHLTRLLLPAPARRDVATTVEAAR
ncbi:MAG: 3-deoxy-D-manno-octulosonic acid transferase [Burkholderiales bacterium]